MRAYRPLIALGVGCGAIFILLFAQTGLEPLAGEIRRAASWSQSAATFFVESITVSELRSGYHEVAATHQPAANLKVLIVPGHRPGSGGTVFRGVYERDIVVDIALELAKYLDDNGHYDVTVARGKDTWNPVLQSYFDTHKAEIDTFRQSQAREMAGHLSDGGIELAADQVDHPTAPAQGALELYGINKWTSEHQYDIVLHLHVNDAGGRRRGQVGKYDGFAVYIPDRQYSNAHASAALGQSIAWRLSAYHATSTLPGESAGVVEDQALIAVGSNNSVDSAALLIEYGYIYEAQFQDASVLPLALRDYAYQTYLGMQDFVADPVTPTYGAVSLPHDWNQVTADSGERGPSEYALQVALRHLGYYPASGDSFVDCPVSGRVGPCTRRAIEAYQRAHGLEAVGTLGPQTREALVRDLATPGGSSLTLE